MGFRQGAVEAMGLNAMTTGFVDPAFWRGRRVLLTVAFLVTGVAIGMLYFSVNTK